MQEINDSINAWKGCAASYHALAALPSDHPDREGVDTKPLLDAAAEADRMVKVWRGFQNISSI